MTNLHNQLNALFSEIVKEAKANPQFADRLQQALGATAETAVAPTQSRRRAQRF